MSSASPNAVLPQSDGRTDDYIPFAVRFRAWWEGVEPGAIVQRGQQPSVRRNRLIVVDAPQQDQEDDASQRAEIRYRLWSRLYGEGFSLPGGIETTTPLLKRAGLESSHTLLDLAAGLGGGTRAAAMQFGASVMGLEPDPEIADLALRLSAIKGLEARVPVSSYNAATVELSERSYDIVLIRERLFGMAERKHLLRQMARAVAHNGKVIVTDLLLADAGAASAPEIEGWCAAERDRPKPWTLGAFQEEASAAGLQLHAYQDDTEAHRKLLIDGWTNFASNLSRDGIDRAFVDVLVGEAESVKRRLAAINGGVARFGYIELRPGQRRASRG